MAFLLRRLHDNGSCKKHCFSQISTSDNNFSFPHDLYAPFPESNHKVVGYCKGLFCLEYDDGKILLWNPSTNEFKLLPRSDMELPPCFYPNCTTCKAHVISRIRGLGFDPKSGDYKVVRFVTVFYANTTNNSKDFDHGSSKRAEVYSLKNDGWKEILIFPGLFEKYDITDEYAIYINGFCCWKGVSKNYEKVIIVLLDLAEDSFSILCLPKVHLTIHRVDSILIEFEGSLGIVIYGTLDIYKVLRPWVWEDGRGRWTEMGFEVSVEVERPLGYCRNGELLLLEGFDRKLLVYDSVTQELNKIDEIYDHPHTMQLFPYVETTVSLSTFDTAFDTDISARPCFLKGEKENIKKEMLKWIKREKRRVGKVLRRRKREKKRVIE